MHIAGSIFIFNISKGQPPVSGSERGDGEPPPLTPAEISIPLAPAVNSKYASPVCPCPNPTPDTSSRVRDFTKTQLSLSLSRSLVARLRADVDELTVNSKNISMFAPRLPLPEMV